MNAADEQRIREIVREEIAAQLRTGGYLVSLPTESFLSKREVKDLGSRTIRGGDAI